MMIGSDICDTASIIASIIVATLLKPGMISGAGEGSTNGVGLVISGPIPPGGAGLKTGGGSVGLIGPSGACGMLGGRYGPDDGPVLNLLNCFSGIHGGTYPGTGGGHLGELVEGAGDGDSQLINLCLKLGSSPDGSLKLVALFPT